MIDSFSVLIPDGESILTLFVMHGFAHIPNVKLHVLSNERWAPARFSRYCSTYSFKQMGANNEERFNAVAEVARRTHADVLLPVETGGIVFAAAKRQELSQLLAVAPVPDLESFEIANNKWLLAQFLQENDIPGPSTILCTLDHDFERQLRTLDFPVLLKPTIGSGGIGMRRFDDLHQLQDFLEEQPKEELGNKHIVQSYIPGFVIGLNVLCREGEILAFTMQRGFIPNPKKHNPAAAIKFIKRDDVLEVGQRFLSALNWSGYANIDMFYDTSENRVKILEVNARFWGSLRGSYVAGVSFPYLACLAALDIPFPVPDYELTRYIHPKTAMKEGILSALGRSQFERFPLEETGLRYLLADPVAESIRALQQQLLNDSQIAEDFGVLRQQLPSDGQTMTLEGA
jgi:predicted ATP-grasp superfamily ATP-dependent carboligase